MRISNKTAQLGVNKNYAGRKKTFKAIISIFRNLSEHLSERKSVATIEHK